MLVVVTFVGSLIAIYSVGYMHGDQGYARYFAEIALFIFSMTGLVLASNFILLYAFWEGVGLCSYLLIGFWFNKPSAAAAARKAFLVTRIGDVGMILGIILLWLRLGPMTGYTLDYDKVFTEATLLDSASLAAICLLLFCGAVGKSAQFPLYVWLPDAMEGPSPVSALIHAATMVTAGVYLVARCMPLFHAAPTWVLLLVAGIGAFTALLAALIALTQNDLKRVLAYSTISQLGYMFLGLGAGTENLVALAVIAAIFHLFTHAFFKALLFLAAGSVMHAMGNVIDMRRFGGLRYVLKTTHWTFLCGAAALAGFPILSGFWSKDEVLATTLAAVDLGHSFGWLYLVLFVSALATAGLTAFYTFRAYFKTFWGQLVVPPEAGEHVHESPPVMLVPLIILALGAVLVGFLQTPWTPWLGNFLSEHWIEAPFSGFRAPKPEAHIHWAVVMLLSSLTAIAGIAAAWWLYVREPGFADRLTRSWQVWYQLSVNKFHVDEIYEAFIVQPLAGFAEFCRVVDQYVVDGIVDLLGHVPRLVGALLRPIQNGLLQFYGLAMVLGLAVFLFFLTWNWAELMARLAGSGK